MALVLVTLLGCLPGVGIGYGLMVVQDQFEKPPEQGPPLPLEDEARKPWASDAPRRPPNDRSRPIDEGVEKQD